MTLEVSEYIVVCTDLLVPDIWVHTAIFRSYFKGGCIVRVHKFVKFYDVWSFIEVWFYESATFDRKEWALKQSMEFVANV